MNLSDIDIKSVEETVAEAMAADLDAVEAQSATPAFADLGLSNTLLDAVSELGYETPTPVQAGAIPEVLAGRDLLAAAQTGTGKTAAFLLPTMDRLPHVKRARGNKLQQGSGPRMLVVTPTRELAQQIEDVCHKIATQTGHSAVTVVGGVSYNPQRSALKRGCDILIATPGRLEGLISQGACMLDEVEVLVLDEADRMLDMGFLPAVRRIVQKTPATRQTLLFSATLDESAVGSITDLVRDPARVEIAPATATADTVDQFLLPVSLEAKNGILAQVLNKYGSEHVIVFCRTKRRADTVSRRLDRAGITSAAIHGDRSQAQRERALKAFRNGTVDVLVATDVLARGIDITDVRYVINFDVPEEPVDYIHRIGRTGRGGEVGWSVTVVTEQDVEEFYDIEALMGKTADLMSKEDLADLDRGAHPVKVDPKRVPKDHVAGKKERKRRRDRIAKKLAAKYGDAAPADFRAGKGKPAGGKGKAAGTKARRDELGESTALEQAGEKPAQVVAAEKAVRDGAVTEQPRESRRTRARRRDAENTASERARGPRIADEAVAEAPKPSRRKRSGRVRVRANGAIGGGEYLSDAERAAIERTGRAGGEGARDGKKGKRAGEGEPRGGRKRGEARGNGGGRDGSKRGGSDAGRNNRAHARGGAKRGERSFDANAERGEGRKPSDDWRNYDDPMGRDRRAARSMQASRQIGRGERRDNRAGHAAPGKKQGRRRPGDNGGRR